MYTELTCLHDPVDAHRSPVVFIHGFPDSPLMWQEYITPTEQAQPWLQGRAIYTFAFPNRQTRPQPIPSWWEVRRGVLSDEFTAALTEVISRSPTGKIIPIAHDLGATYAWTYARQRTRAGQEVGFEKLVALSVGSSLRYDIWEHGLNALTWLYQVIYIVPYTIRLRPLQALLAYLLVNAAGYRSATAAEVWRDVYHYWEGWLWPLRLPFYLLGWAYERPFLNYHFPVLYMRSHMDRIASTQAFEADLGQRPGCRFVKLPGTFSHWFPEQNADLVLAEIRPFLAA